MKSMSIYCKINNKSFVILRFKNKDNESYTVQRSHSRGDE